MKAGTSLVNRRPNHQKAEQQAAQDARPSVAEDVQLIERIRNGETEAYGELVKKYQDRLFNTCWRISGHLDDARDLTQEAFLRAYEKLPTFRDQSSFYTWIYRVAVNLALSHRRTTRRRRQVTGDQAAGTQAEQLAERASQSKEDAPEQAADEAELQQTVARALQELDDEHRAVVVLRDIEGFDYAEIAEILEIPTGTVKSRLHRARMTLRAAMLPTLRPEQTQS
jgi:RNA polymerase sigma-70 factor, ECF subfamily